MAVGTVPEPKPRSKVSRYFVIVLLVLLALGWLLGGGNKAKEAASFLVGSEEYVYGYPLVMMDVTRQVMTAAANTGEYSGPIDQFARLRAYVSPDFKDVGRISVNSLWSVVFLDLDKEPMIVSSPDMGDRFIVVQAMDMWTDNFTSVGSRTNGGKAKLAADSTVGNVQPYGALVSAWRGLAGRQLQAAAGRKDAIKSDQLLCPCEEPS